MYRIETDRRFDSPSLIVAFDGWVDAAAVGSATAERLAGDSEVVVTFDADALFDFRVNRPIADFVDGRLADVRYPKVEIQARRIGDRDLLVMRGTEPEFRWLELGRAVVELASEFRVAELVCVGSVPAAVAHTRPTNVMVTSTVSRPASSGRVPEGLLRVPAAAVTSIEWHLASAGVATIGFWAQVPHYVSGPYHQGVVALLEHVGSHLGIEPPIGGLVDDAISQREQLDRLVDANPEIQAHLERLELLSEPDDLPTAEELGSEIERFLRDAGDGE